MTQGRWSQEDVKTNHQKSSVSNRTIVFSIVGCLAFILVAWAVFIVVANQANAETYDFDACIIKVQETLAEQNIEYSLTYCGIDGNYCETIIDKNLERNQAIEDCSNDPRYVDEGYIGTYTYIQDYMNSRRQPEP